MPFAPIVAGFTTTAVMVGLLLSSSSFLHDEITETIIIPKRNRKLKVLIFIPLLFKLLML